MMLMMSLTMLADKMQVVSFGKMDDIDARQSGVRDTRGELCALVKVVIPLSNVVFEGSMVIRSEQRSGEYWVFLPRQAREFTIKHSHLVPLTYTFEERLVSGNTYRMEVEVPEKIVLIDYKASLEGNAVDMKTIIMAQYGYNPAPQHSWGLAAGQLFGSWGYYLSFRSNYQFAKATVDWVCDEDGMVDGVMPFYSGETKKSHVMATAGVVWDFLFNRYGSSYAALYLGAGYGHRYQLWGTIDGDWVRYTPDAVMGVGADLGFMGCYKGFTCMVGVSTINFRYAELAVGIGYTISHRKSK